MTIHFHNPRNIDNREPEWVRLMAGIFAEAVRDARSKDPLRALDAVFWLLGPDAKLYLDAIGGMDDLDPVNLVVSGRARSNRAIGPIGR